MPVSRYWRDYEPLNPMLIIGAYDATWDFMPLCVRPLSSKLENPKIKPRRGDWHLKLP